MARYPSAQAIAEAHDGKRDGSVDGRAAYTMRCPAHDDHKPSLRIWENPAGERPGLRCMSTNNCDYWTIAALLGFGKEELLVPPPPPGHVCGALCAVYQRADGSKPYRTHREERADGKRIWGDVGPEYNSSTKDLLAKLWHPQGGDTSFVVVAEGEKAAHALQQAGITSASWPGGSANARHSVFDPLLEFNTIYLWPDNDDSGAQAMNDVGACLERLGYGGELWLLFAYDSIPHHGDAADVDRDDRLSVVLAVDRWLAWQAPAIPAPPAARSEAPRAAGKLDRNQMAVYHHDHYLDEWAYAPARGWYMRRGQLWARDAEALELRLSIQQLIDAGISQKSLAADVVARTLEPVYMIDSNVLDANDLIVGLPSGRVLDLTNGTVGDAPADSYVTKRLSAEPDTTEEPARWMRFLKQTFSEPELIAWLRWWLKQSLRGDTAHESLLFLWGPPGSGKSTFAETWSHILGEYASRVPAARLAEDNNSHRSWIAALEGQRLVVVNELPTHGKWQTTELNALVSGEPITANFMRRDDFTFRPRAHVLVVGNHRPQASAEDGFWRRLRLVECRHVVAENKQDQTLKAVLRAESDAILAWAILAPDVEPSRPVSMAASAREYRQEADEFFAWTEQCIVFEDNADTKGNDLWHNYETWCNDASVNSLSKPQFMRRLTARYIDLKVKATGGNPVRYLGIRARLAESEGSGVPAQSASVTCGDCGGKFGSPDAVSRHKAECPVRREAR